jgi:hypothetical protein
MHESTWNQSITSEGAQKLSPLFDHSSAVMVEMTHGKTNGTVTDHKKLIATSTTEN